MPSLLLSLDLGSTHFKAGLFTEDGRVEKSASRKMILQQDPQRSSYFDPDQLWDAVVEVIRDIRAGIDPKRIAAIGITSMAETGLLLEDQTGEPRTPLIPWFDPVSTDQAAWLGKNGDPFERFKASGMRPNFKCSLAKLLWLRSEDPKLLEAATWLSTADLVAYKLSGVMATDYSLAGRTYAFNIQSNLWEADWLHSLDFKTQLFPPAVPSGQPIGNLTSEAALLTDLLQGTPIAICGHDHVCAAFAILGNESGRVFDSMGTAEALLGVLDKESIGATEYESGLVFGRHVSGNNFYWMGGMSASGGSLEWVRNILGDPALTYTQVETILGEAPPGPTGILYLPYLSGSGSPHTDIHARGAFVGLKANHQRAELIKAVLEGTSYEAEFIRQAAEDFLGVEIGAIAASGGGTRIGDWMQIKADVFGCPVEVSAASEATLLGAALIAGIGIGLYADTSSAISATVQSPTAVYYPDESQHQAYQNLYSNGYIPLQKPLRQVYRNLGRQ
jgi:sugar (pentulose or hexulose) kinase